MILPSRAVRVWVHRQPVDMRKSFDTLAAVVRVEMRRELLDGERQILTASARRYCPWWPSAALS